MLRLVIVLVVVVAALLRGGSLRRFAELQLRWVPLVLAGLGLQLLIFTPFRETAIIPTATAALYLLSMLLLAGWVAGNRHVPGILLIAAGVLMNLAAIAANNGYMPVDPLAAQYAGIIDNYPQGEQPIANNSFAAAQGVRLWILTDIFPVPGRIPLATVYSLGDILLTTGVGILCYRTMLGPRAAAPAAQSWPGAAAPALAEPPIHPVYRNPPPFDVVQEGIQGGAHDR